MISLPGKRWCVNALSDLAHLCLKSRLLTWFIVLILQSPWPTSSCVWPLGHLLHTFGWKETWGDFETSLNQLRKSWLTYNLRSKEVPPLLLSFTMCPPLLILYVQIAKFNSKAYPKCLALFLGPSPLIVLCSEHWWFFLSIERWLWCCITWWQRWVCCSHCWSLPCYFVSFLWCLSALKGS